MKIHTDFSTLQHVSRTVVTIGTFDGVHLGHRTILQHLQSTTRSVGGESVLLTFYPHPRMVLHPEDHHLQLLSTPEEKAALLEQAGLDHLMVFPFSKEFSRLPAFDYVRDLLVQGLHAHTVVVGYDHRFGRNREGSHATLLEMAELFGFAVDEIPARVIDDVQVSSTKIRETLTRGLVEDAARFLGYRYRLTGNVVHGASKGKTIGFPTANIQPDYTYKMIPANGVYAIDALLEGRSFSGVLNIGVRPTVQHASQRTIEAHLFNFDESIYDQRLTVVFKKKLRDEMKFGSIDALKKQIEADIALARAIL